MTLVTTGLRSPLELARVQPRRRSLLPPSQDKEDSSESAKMLSAWKKKRMDSRGRHRLLRSRLRRTSVRCRETVGNSLLGRMVRRRVEVAASESYSPVYS